jgi:carboxyl-terminal processing protease
MKNTTRITLVMSVLMVVGMVISLCGGLAGGIVLDRQVLNRPKAVALVPTHAASTRTPSIPRSTPTDAPPGSPTLEATPTDEPTSEAPLPSSTDVNLDLISEAWQAIQQHYVDRTAIDGLKLTYGAIAGMVNALGDTGHSRFTTAEAYKSEMNSLQGSNTFEGIGVFVESRNGQTVVVAPIDGTPAQKAGILPGDIIEKVNGEDISGLAIEQVIPKILGPAGTTVTLTILTPTTNLEKELTLTRAKITVANVTWQALPGTTIAHLRIVQFSNGSTDDLKKALEEIKKQNMTGVILDLRNNPGGLVDEAVGVTSQFLSGGTVYLEKDAAGKEKKIPVSKGGTGTQIPLIILVNRGSASASEITAGAIQDAGRAKVVGEITFGTGTVLTSFPLSDGSVLTLAIREWLTPKGRVIWHKGLTPDEEVKLDLNVQPLTPEGERTMSAADLQASKDKQLLRAIELFK